MSTKNNYATLPHFLWVIVNSAWPSLLFAHRKVRLSLIVKRHSLLYWEDNSHVDFDTKLSLVYFHWLVYASKGQSQVLELVSNFCSVNIFLLGTMEKLVCLLKKLISFCINKLKKILYTNFLAVFVAEWKMTAINSSML